MVKYIITTENGTVQETFTGKELYCKILDKFKIKYTVDVEEESKQVLNFQKEKTSRKKNS